MEPTWRKMRTPAAIAASAHSHQQRVNLVTADLRAAKRIRVSRAALFAQDRTRFAKFSCPRRLRQTGPGVNITPLKIQYFYKPKFQIWQ
jgi:hypothetical protein